MKKFAAILFGLVIPKMPPTGTHEIAAIFLTPEMRHGHDRDA
jgi:hypothetical protein